MVNRIFHPMVLFVLFLVACQSTPAPTISPSSTSSPNPTNTLLPTPTVSRTPIATADFTSAELYGIWSRSDPDRGNLYIAILEDGVFKASHGTPEGIVHSGKYTLDGCLFTFISGWNCAPLPDTTQGFYVLRLGGGGQWLYLDLAEDKCPDRSAALAKYRWTRFIPTPAPTP
jgi:hypothetical protein